MGLDAYIFVKVKEEEHPDLYDWPRIILVPSDSGCERTPIGATHQLDNSYRYWSGDSPRGPCPEIVATLMALKHNPTIEAVWYGHDCDFHALVTTDVILDLVRDYLE
jgi:hypothetical protein